MKVIAITNDWIFFLLLVPPSYEDAMALSEKFYDDTEYMENVSMSSVATNTKTETFKPRYPVYYEYETPIIPPGSDDSNNESE